MCLGVENKQHESNKIYLVSLIPCQCLWRSLGVSVQWTLGSLFSSHNIIEVTNLLNTKQQQNCRILLFFLSVPMVSKTWKSLLECSLL